MTHPHHKLDLQKLPPKAISDEVNYSEFVFSLGCGPQLISFPEGRSVIFKGKYLTI